MPIDEYRSAAVVERCRNDGPAAAPAASAVVRTLDSCGVRPTPAPFRRRDRRRSSDAGALCLESTLDGWREGGYVLLRKQPPRDLLLGLVGRFWTPPERLHRLEAEQRQRGARRGCAEAARNSSPARRLVGTVRFAAETPECGSGHASEERFLTHRRRTAPFRGPTRREMLLSARGGIAPRTVAS